MRATHRRRGLAVLSSLWLAAVSCSFPDFPFGSAEAGSDEPVCAKDCLGGACVAGRCQPVTLYADADGGPGGIYISELGAVYFTQYYGGRVLRDLADGNVEPVAANLAYPVRLTGSAQGTFATAYGEGDADAGQIVVIGASGVARRIVAGPRVAGYSIAPWGIVDTGRSLVWTNAVVDGSVMMAAQDGRSAAIVATGGRPQELVANAEYAWWVDAERSRLFRASLSRTGEPVVVTPDFVDSIVYSGGRLYTASTYNLPSIGVIDDPMATGTSIRELVSRYVLLSGTDRPAVQSPHGLALDDVYVYWVNVPGRGPTSSLVRVRIDGSSPPELLADGIERPDQVAVTSTAIYWTSFSGTVQRLAKP
jgi:hypothetical protein